MSFGRRRRPGWSALLGLLCQEPLLRAESTGQVPYVRLIEPRDPTGDLDNGVREGPFPTEHENDVERVEDARCEVERTEGHEDLSAEMTLGIEHENAVAESDQAFGHEPGGITHATAGVTADEKVELRGRESHRVTG